ncbi:MAG: electron transporter RnfD [Huintestinicola sp.]
MKISFNDERINYMGRIGMYDDGARFYYAASTAEVMFTGTKISVEINNKTVWGTLCLGYIIDGRLGKAPLPRSNDGQNVVYTLAESLEQDKIHRLVIFKRHAANHMFILKSIETDGEILEAPERPALRLEVYGDSVSAGEVSEAVEFTGRCDPSSHDSIYDNPFYSYTWQTARLLNAELHDIAQGGIAVFDDTGYFHWPKMIGMESVYDKECYFPEGGDITPWDFSRYTPHIVIFALGQNDKHNGITEEDDIDIHDPEYRLKWKNGYKDIVRNVHSHYPSDTKYIFITTLLMHDEEWDNAIGEISDELNAEGMNTYHLLFSRNGAATPGHPRIPEHAEMAGELTAFINHIMK